MANSSKSDSDLSVNIKTRLIGLIMLVLVSSLWLNAVINANRIERDMTQLLSAQQFSVASYIAEDIDSKLRLRIEVLNASAAGITPELLASTDKARDYLKGKSGYIAISVPKYRLIATSSDPTRVLDVMAKPGVNLMLDRFVAGYEGSGIAVNSKGIETLTSAKRIPSAGWIAQIVLPTEEAFAPVRAMRLRAYEIAGALSALAILLAWFLLRRVLRPLDVATREIANMAAGKVVLHEISVSRNDEIGVLLTSFNMLIEQRHKIERALADSEQSLRTIIETEPECIKQLANDGSLLSINGAGLNMIEADSLQQVIGQKVQQLVTPEYRDAFVALTQSVFDGKSGTMVFEIQGLKGGRRWLETHAVPLRDSEQKIIALLAITRDVTGRKQHEAAQGEAKRQLELQLAEITQLQTRLQDQVVRDSLTGLNNRRYLDQARQRAEAWRLSFASTPVGYGDFSIPVTLSAGIAVFPDHGGNADKLISCADEALYRAKNAGRNCVTCFGVIE